MPLQNRPDPSGGLHAVADLGLFTGSRGGRFDRDDQALEDRHWTSGRWIFCAARFKEGLVWTGHLRANATIDRQDARAAGKIQTAPGAAQRGDTGAPVTLPGGAPGPIQDGAARARSFRGYGARQPLHAADRRLTSQITRDALQSGYGPNLHPSETA